MGQLASVVASPLMSGTTTCLPQLLAQLLQIIIYILQSGETRTPLLQAATVLWTRVVCSEWADGERAS